MSRIQVSPTRDYFVRDGKPFFYLADTLWMGMRNLSPSEFERYLDFRVLQGFNAIQICPLFSLGNATNDQSIFGFEVEAGKPNYEKMNLAFFDKAESFVKMIYKRRMIPVIFPVWVNFVPGTFTASLENEINVMSLKQMRHFVQYCVRRFNQYEPIYSVSGDTAFETPQVCEYYEEALRVIKSISPETLTTMHMTTSESMMPASLMENQNLDFIMYQSGHDEKYCELAHTGARMYANYSKTKRPVVNGEPCYEGIHRRNMAGRFSQIDVRNIIWQSLLSGAKAGISYGAHGLWNAQQRAVNRSPISDFYPSFTWDEAMMLPGAWEPGFAKWIFETFHLFEIEPSDKLLPDQPDFCMSKDNAHIVIYIPYASVVRVAVDLREYDFRAIVMDTRQIVIPTVRVKDGSSLIEMLPFNTDVLFIGVRTED